MLSEPWRVLVICILFLDFASFAIVFACPARRALERSARAGRIAWWDLAIATIRTARSKNPRSGFRAFSTPEPPSYPGSSFLLTSGRETNDPGKNRFEVRKHSRPQSSSLLRITDGEESSGEPWDQALSLFLVGWNKENVSDCLICDAVKFERALGRLSRLLGNFMFFFFYANHRSCTQS